MSANPDVDPHSAPVFQTPHNVVEDLQGLLLRLQTLKMYDVVSMTGDDHIVSKPDLAICHDFVLLAAYLQKYDPDSSIITDCMNVASAIYPITGKQEHLKIFTTWNICNSNISKKIMQIQRVNQKKNDSDLLLLKAYIFEIQTSMLEYTNHYNVNRVIPKMSKISQSLRNAGTRKRITECFMFLSLYESDDAPFRYACLDMVRQFIPLTGSTHTQQILNNWGGNMLNEAILRKILFYQKESLSGNKSHFIMILQETLNLMIQYCTDEISRVSSKQHTATTQNASTSSTIHSHTNNSRTATVNPNTYSISNPDLFKTSYIAWWGFEDHLLHYIKDISEDHTEYVTLLKPTKYEEFPKGWDPMTGNDGFKYLEKEFRLYRYISYDAASSIIGKFQRTVVHVPIPIQQTPVHAHHSGSASPARGSVSPARHVQYTTPHVHAHHSGYGRVVHQRQYTTTPGYHTYNGGSNLYPNPKVVGERYYNRYGNPYVMYGQLSTENVAGPCRCEGCPGCDGTPGDCRCVGKCRCVHDA